MQMQVTSISTWTYQFRESHLHTFAAHLAGMTRQEATAWLMQQPGVHQVSFDGALSEQQGLPGDPARVHVVVLAPMEE